jgi:hypothetical protein
LPNRTIGREDGVRAIAHRLSVGGARLLTLIGPGGVGKTRPRLEVALAMQCGFRRGRAVRFADLGAPSAGCPGCGRAGAADRAALPSARDRLPASLLHLRRSSSQIGRSARS